MATQRYYLTNGVDANGWQALSTTAQTAADTAAGWVVGTGATNNSELAANTERASTTFTGTTVPDGTLDTSLKDAFRIPVAINGTFASANWTFQFTVVSPTQSGAADGQIVFRLIKANADGSSATEITSAQQSASVCTNVGSTDLGTSANVGTLTFNPGAITLAANQFLFIQIAWKRTGAGGMTTTNIRFRTGSSTTAGTSILTADFTPATQSVTTVNIAATSVVNVPVVVQPLDITVAATVSTASARGSRAVVFPSQFIGYCFYVDSGGVFGYSKTTDGGDSWGAHVDVDGAAATTVVAFDIWFDQWTPGDTGTLIHCWWFDSTNNIVRWRTLNITGDTLGTVRTVFTGASAVAGRGAFVSGTKTRSGYLYCAYDIDAGTERGLHRSTDSGTTWSTNLATTFVEATLDTCKLFPASGTGDNNDCWALYYDQSATALTLKLWDSSAVAQVESATIGVAHTDGPTDLTGQYGYDAAVRHTDGHLIIATVSQRDVAASVHEVFDCTSTSTITAKTSIAASTDDHYFPQVFINQGTGTIFVAYNGKRDGSEVLDTTTKVYYTYSLNGGTTWNAGDAAYMQDAAGPVQQVWTPMSGSRFYVIWRSGTTLYGNKVNSLIQLGSQLPTIDATSVVNVPTIAPGPVAVVMATIATTAALSLPTVSFPATPAQDVTGAFISGVTAPTDLLLNSLKGYWKLDETSSASGAADATGLTNLVAVGTPGVNSGGKIGYCRFFVDWYNYLKSPTSPWELMLSPDSPFTLSVWVYMSDRRGVQFISKFTQDPPNATQQTEYQISCGAGGSAYDAFLFIVGNGTTWGIAQATTFGPPSVGVWYHIVAWHDPILNTVNIQINDGAVDSVSWSGGTQNSTQAMYLAIQDNDTSAYLNGALDEIGYWRRVLTTSERTALHNAGAALSYDSFVGGGVGLKNALVSYWKMDETSGTAFDAHAGNSMPSFFGNVGADTGKINGARHFNGTAAQRLGAYNTSDFQTGDIDFTISFWVYLESLANYQFIVCKDDNGGNREYGVYFDFGSGKLDFYVFYAGSSLTQVANTTWTPTIGAWAHVVAWHDAVNNLIAIAVNDGIPNTAAHSSGVNNLGSSLGVGAISNGDYPLTGRVDELGFWKRVLTSTERTALYNGGSGLSYDDFVPTGGGGTTMFAPIIVPVVPQTVLGAFIGGGGLTTSLESYWKLDEASGNALDAHGTNPLTPVNTPGSGTGKINGAREFFSAATQYLTHATNASLDTGDIDFTVSAWVQFYSTGAFDFFVSKDAEAGGNTTREWGVYFTPSDGHLRFFVFDPGGTLTQVENTSVVASVGPWYHVVVWHDATTNQISIQINGGTVFVASHSGGVRTGTAGFAIGAQSNAMWPHDGQVDEVGFWKRLLTSDERAALYNSGAGLSYTAFGAGASAAFAPTVTPSTTGPQTILGAFIPGPLGTLLNSLASYWAFDEATNSFSFDSHGSGTLNYGGNPAPVTGKLGNARQINGSNYFQLMYPSNIPVTLGSNSPFTISTWVYLTDKSTDRTIIVKATTLPVTDTNQFEYWLHYNVASDRFVIIVGNGTTFNYVHSTTSGSPPLNTWLHIVCWNDPTGFRLGIQVNGVTDSVGVTGFTQGSTNFVYFGLDVTGEGDDWLGNIDETAFWNRVLTAGERTALWNSGAGLSYAAISSLSVRGVFGPTVTLVDQAVVGATIYPTTLVTETLLVQSVTTIDTSGASYNSHNQTISGHTGLLTSVSVYLGQINTPPGTIKIEIRDGYLGTVLASSPTRDAQTLLHRFTGSDYAWVNFPLTTPLSLSAGTTYWLGVVTSDTTNTISTAYGTGNQYPGGSLMFGSVPSLDGTFDTAFRLYTGASHTVAIVGPSTQTITGGFIGASSLRTGLLSYWKLDETESGSSALDAHGGNILAPTRNVGVATGIVGGARQFVVPIPTGGAASSFLSRPAGNLYAGGGASWTASAWVYFNYQATWNDNYQTILGQNAYNTGYSIQNDPFSGATSTDGRLSLQVSLFPSGGQSISSGSGVFPLHTWIHVIAWFNAATNEIGMSSSLGSENIGTTGAGLRILAGDPFSIGARGTGECGFDGLIDEVGFWSRALTSTERTALRNGGTALPYEAFGGTTMYAPTVSGVGGLQTIGGAYIGGTYGQFLDQLVAYWDLNEASGNAFDVHGSNTLTDHNGVGTVATNPSFPTGGGTARHFTAASAQYLDIADNLPLSMSGSFTISAWVKFDSLGTRFVVTKDDAGSNSEYGCYLDSTSNRLKFYVFSPGGTVTIATANRYVSQFSAINNVSWYHVLGWYDAINGVVGIQVNGQGEGYDEVVQTAGVKDGTAPFAIGSRGASANPMDGSIDEVAVWRRTLTSREKQDLYNGLNGRLYQVFRAGTARIFQPTVKRDTVAMPFIASGNTPFAPTVTQTSTQGITGAFIGGGTLLTSLISYWKLDEASGNALDAHGTNPLIETSGTIDSAAGIITTARDFEAGDTEYFSKADNADLSAGDIDFSFSCWVKAESLVSFPVIIGKNSADGIHDEYALYYHTGDDKLCWSVRSASGPTQVEGPVLSTGVWYHIVCWHDSVANEIGVVVNAGAPSTQAWANGVFDWTNDFNIGASSVQSLYWDGLINEVGFWKRVLTSPEKTALYNSGSGLSYASFSGGSSVFAPTVVPSAPGTQSITTTFIGSTSQVNVPTVTTGAVTVVGGTVASTTIVRALTVTTGAVTVGATTRPTTIQVFTPTVTAMVFGATIVSGSGAFPPSLAQTVTTAHRATTIQLFAPSVGVTVTTPGLATTIQVFAPTIATGPVTVTGATCATTIQVFAPTVAPGTVTITTPGRPTTAQVNAPTIAVGAVSVTTPGRVTTIQVFAPVVSMMVTGATIPSGSGVFAPSVIQNVTLAHRPTTIQLFAPTVAPGAVTVILPHRATTIQVFAPSVAPQPVTITGAFCSTTTQVFAPSLALTVLGATRTSTAVLFPPSLSMSVTTAFIAATTVLYPPTVLPSGALGGPTASSTLQVFPPTVVRTLSLVTGAFIGSLQSSAAPSVTTLTFVVLSHRTATLQIFSPIVTPGAVPVSGATIPAASLCFAPSISTGVTGVGGAFINSTALLRVPSVTTLTFVFTAALAGTSQTFAPAIRPGITTGFISSTVDVFPPAVLTQLQVTVGGLTSTARLFPPSVGGFPAGTCATAGLAVRYLVTSATMTHAVLVQGSVAVRYLGTGAITCKPSEAVGDVGVRVIVTASVGVSCCGSGVLP